MKIFNLIMSTRSTRSKKLPLFVAMGLCFIVGLNAMDAKQAVLAYMKANKGTLPKAPNEIMATCNASVMEISKAIDAVRRDLRRKAAANGVKPSRPTPASKFGRSPPKPRTDSRDRAKIDKVLHARGIPLPATIQARKKALKAVPREPPSLRKPAVADLSELGKALAKQRAPLEEKLSALAKFHFPNDQSVSQAPWERNGPINPPRKRGHMYDIPHPEPREQKSTLLPKSVPQVPVAAQAKIPFQVGDIVEGYWKCHRTWYPAKIVLPTQEDLERGLFRLQFTDGSGGATLTPENIRFPPNRKKTIAQAASQSEFQVGDRVQVRPGRSSKLELNAVNPSIKASIAPLACGVIDFVSATHPGEVSVKFDKNPGNIFMIGQRLDHGPCTKHRVKSSDLQLEMRPRSGGDKFEPAENVWATDHHEGGPPNPPTSKW